MLTQASRCEKRTGGNSGSTAVDVGGRVLTGHMGGGAQVAPGIMSSREAGWRLRPRMRWLWNAENLDVCSDFL